MSRRDAVTVGVLVVGSLFFTGPLGAATALVGTGAWVTGRVRPRVLLVVATCLVCLAPFAWLLGNLSRLGTVSAALVTLNPWPDRLVLVALVLLVVGMSLELLGSRGDDADA